MKAKDISVAYVFGSASENYEIEERINKWLRVNPDREIIDIKFGYGQGDCNSYANALIIYKKVKYVNF